MADDHRRAALGPRELAEHVVERRGARVVELAGRLVGEEQPRPVRERGTDDHALLLAAGELVRPRVALRLEADALEQLVGPAAALAARRALQPESEPDELARGQLGASARE